MYKLKPYFLFVLMILPISLYQSTVTYAHGGRTDAFGCHIESATGIEHCHNDDSSSSYSNGSSGTDSYENQYKDHDQNGVNDYEQNSSQLAENIKSMGDRDGFEDAEYSYYEPDPKYYNFSNTEKIWYQQGYEEGYHRKKLQLLIKEAYDEGYQSGLITDEKVIPSKYLDSEKVKESYNKGFEKAQQERWTQYAKETGFALKPLVIPDTLPQKIKDKAQERYDGVLKNEMKNIYEAGYQFAFTNETLNVPQQYKQISSIEKEFRRGFQENTEIANYKKQAFEEGKRIKRYKVPAEVQAEGAEIIYKKYFDKGQQVQMQTIYKWLLRLGLPVVGIAIFIFYLYRSYLRKARVNAN